MRFTASTAGGQPNTETEETFGCERSLPCGRRRSPIRTADADSSEDVLSRRRWGRHGDRGTTPESGGRPQERLRGSSAPGPAPCANNPKRTPEAEDPRQHLQWGRKQWTTPELLAVRVPPTLLECVENPS